MTGYNLHVREHATVMAALSAWRRVCQGEQVGIGNIGEECNLATSGEAFAALKQTEINDLMEKLSHPQTTTVVIEHNGGVIEHVMATSLTQVVFLDADTEGADLDQIATVRGEKVYVQNHKVSPTEEDLGTVHEVLEDISVLVTD